MSQVFAFDRCGNCKWLGTFDRGMLCCWAVALGNIFGNKPQVVLTSQPIA